MAQNQRKIRRHIIRGLLIAAGLFIITTLGAYIWFIRNANSLLINMVNEKSKGKFALELSKVTFNIFSREVKIFDAKIFNTSQGSPSITYNVAFSRVNITTNSLWSAFLSRKLEVRTIKMVNPLIEVMDWGQRDSTTHDELSLGLQLGKLYHTADNAITSLNTRSISLENARIILINKAEPDKKPLEFSNIFFTLRRPATNLGPGYNINNILFKSSDQDLTLSDGIHKLQFRNLSIQNGKNIFLDSCTIYALPKVENGNSFNIHFVKLALIGVDFDALYKSDLIRADSVYCDKPSAYFFVNNAIGERKKISLDFDEPSKLVEDFAGNLDLGFLGVNDGNIFFKIRENKTQSNFTSGKVNFQINKLRVNPAVPVPVTLSSFDMLINGYQLYNADSSCVYTFDSIRFANDKLLLNNFSVHTASNVNHLRNYRNFTVPYFELADVDWPELIFRQNIRAKKALLREPTFNFRQLTTQSKNARTPIFNASHTFDDFMQIDILKVENGKVNIHWNNSNSFQLEGFNVTLFGDNITDYKHVKQRDIQSLFFTAGYLNAGGLEARLQDITFNSDNRITAANLFINKSDGAIEASMSQISIDNIYTSENYDELILDQLKWKDGRVVIHAFPQVGKKSRKSSLLIKNISGNQTQFEYERKAVTAKAFLTDIDITELEKDEAGPFDIKGLTASGRKLGFAKESMKLAADSFHLDNSSQQFRNLTFEKKDSVNTIVMQIPTLSIKKDIEGYLKNDQHFDDIVMLAPKISFIGKADGGKQQGKDSMQLTVGRIRLAQPKLDIRIDKQNISNQVSIPGDDGGNIEAERITLQLNEFKIGSLSIDTRNIKGSFNEKDFIMDEQFKLQANNIKVARSGAPSWDANISSLILKNKAGFQFKTKTNTLQVEDIRAGNISLHSSFMRDKTELLKANTRAWINTTSGKLVTKKASLDFSNAAYNASEKILSLSSFSVKPLKSRDEIIGASAYQTDYITVKSGAVKLLGFDLENFVNDDSLSIQKASITSPALSVFRDRKPPYFEGDRKEFFTEQIKNIAFPIYVKQVEINNGEVAYTEKNKDNRLEGTLLLSAVNGHVKNIKNYRLNYNDSLSFSFAGKLLDEAGFKVQLRQSYTDPLSTFNMSVSVDPSNLIFLNQLLAPLSSLEFKSGKIDKLEMTATGNENIATGEMNLYYQGLRVKLLKNGGLDSSRFIKPAESALINAFIIRKQNADRKGLVFFKRIKERSFFNYMNNILMSGIITSVGAKRNKNYQKQISKYRHAAKK